MPRNFRLLHERNSDYGGGVSQGVRRSARKGGLIASKVIPSVAVHDLSLIESEANKFLPSNHLLDSHLTPVSEQRTTWSGRGMRHYSLVVLGAGGVGKSALTVRYVRNEWKSFYDPTIEEEYRKEVSIDGQVDTLEILDTAGTEQFTTLNERYIQSGRGFLLVFSLTQEASLEEVDNLRNQILHIKSNDHTVPIIVVGTKLDLESEREVKDETIQSLAHRWNIPFYETSAKKNWNVQEVFDDMVRLMRKRYPYIDHVKKKRSSASCVIA